MARVQPSCNDALLFSLLAYSIVTLVLRWDSYHACSEPLQLFLLVDYSTIAVFRCTHFVIKWSFDQALWIQNALYFFKFGVVYTFFVAWTVVGTVWLNQSGDCLPGKNQYWTFVVWLVLCYIWSVLYLCYIVLHCMVRSRDVANNGGGGAAAAANAHFPLSLIHIEDQLGLSEDQIERIHAYTAPMDSMSEEICAICLDGYKREHYCKKLPNCTHAFHATCIDNWLRRKSDCPICRNPVVFNAT